MKFIKIIFCTSLIVSLINFSPKVNEEKVIADKSEVMKVLTASTTSIALNERCKFLSKNDGKKLFLFSYGISTQIDGDPEYKELELSIDENSVKKMPCDNKNKNFVLKSLKDLEKLANVMLDKKAVSSIYNEN